MAAAYFTTSMSDTTTVTVTEATALRYPAVWAAVQCIAGDVASLPFFHYRKRGEAKERYTTSKLYTVLHDEFNPEMTAFTGRETMTAHLLLWGNAYAEIVRNDIGQVTQLWPIEPSRVMPERDERTGGIIYRVLKDDGTEVRVPAERILHVVGLGFNGLMGYSVIGMMRESLGVGLAAERLGGQVMERGAKYSGFFEHPRTLGATALKNIKESIASDLPGSYRILEEGMTYKAGSMPLRDAQFMELRGFQITEVARIFGVPPHKLGDLTHATFSNIEEQNIDYVIGTLRRWLVRWEKECNRKLIAPLEKKLQFTEHLVDGLLRGNIQSRYQAYAQGVNNGFLSPNDIRKFENLDPIPGGDTYLVQGAMVPLDRLDDLVDKQVAPPPAPTAPPAPANGNGAEDEEEDEEEEAASLRLVSKLVADLRTEVTDRTAALPAAIVAALPPMPPPPAAPPDIRPEVLAAMQAITTELSTSITRSTETVTTMLAGVTLPPPATVEELRAWREATFASLAGRFTRRELAQLRRRELDPMEALPKLEAFYRRFVGDGLAELRPWLLRLSAPDRVGGGGDGDAGGGGGGSASRRASPALGDRPGGMPDAGIEGGDRWLRSSRPAPSSWRSSGWSIAAWRR
jgi:HK97 family phage portal protein